METDKSENWLLQSVIYWTSPIGILGASEESVWDWFGYPGLDLGKEELIDILHRLFQRGDLIAFKTDSDPLNERPKFVPTRKDIEEGISSKLCFAYGITAKAVNGGKPPLVLIGQAFLKLHSQT